MKWPPTLSSPPSCFLCPDIILIGGSHNFGQGQNYQNTLQGMLDENGLSVLNISIPGFGLSNSISLLKVGKFREYLENKCKGKEIDAVIYRFILDHIPRDVGKSSINIYGHDYRQIKPGGEVKSYCQNLFSCARYFFMYTQARLLFYTQSTQNEKSGRAIFFLMQPLLKFTDKDFKIIYNVHDDVMITLRQLNVSNLFFVIEPERLYLDKEKSYLEKKLTEYREKSRLRYQNLVYKKDEISLFLRRDYDHPNVCKFLMRKENFIPNEGHPTHCLNRKIFHYIKNKIR